ncbi:phosphoglycerate mutase [Dendrothele bispora CBS 962.96]|uniref:Phosphoglycerate mutase n=1 Tax=Dendrothele bispora (strain CBS 962.96) TaxID=1314807 RepID=A0A4V4HEV4_DENBC|nr:phosphoglycerate mutase [Dendrothele bispora CBS 962.96]
MLTVTFVRHGESEDNLKALWAGWKDAPLSKLGNLQAAAIGAYFRSVTLSDPSLKPHTIYASPLLRAHSTGQAIYDAQPDPKPAFIVTPDIREQHFGVAEGNPWTYHHPPDKTAEELITEGIYPVLYERHEKFPEGESLDDLQERAERAVKECVMPHLEEIQKKDDVGDDHPNRHIVMTSHGLCISELVGAVVRLDPSWPAGASEQYKGLMNTAWVRVVIEPRLGSFFFSYFYSDSSYKVRVTNFNEAGHLKGLSDENTDETANAEARAFFGGGTKALEAEKQSVL